MELLTVPKFFVYRLGCERDAHWRSEFSLGRDQLCSCGRGAYGCSEWTGLQAARRFSCGRAAYGCLNGRAHSYSEWLSNRGNFVAVGVVRTVAEHIPPVANRLELWAWCVRLY